ncbi:MAG: TIGR00341 family protein [Xanthomonadales bacterium]|nr:TIGR00341 family protein [Gammaproteobacteria bacterium]MBT8055242.1 TIGR00341 family protein [Gammaproteobacteria bacterium]NND57024.1 TIGR00341 family protein [Xanthomonadales bacterium]NNK51893.1 TIGR00341 family protein [Xanthomonadales bacterium]
MRVIDVITPADHLDTVLSIAEKHCKDHWVDGGYDDGRQTVHLLVPAGSTQKVLDSLQTFLGSTEKSRIVVSTVEATLPAIEEEVSEINSRTKGIASSREELLGEMEKSSKIDLNFLILVFLSTIVAAVGLIKDNVAVVIGAMVIAPLLGPNLSLALGTALGEKHLMWRSVKTNLAGLGLTLVLALLIGFLWPVDISSPELMARTDVGLDSVALALASGAAGVLSITTGLSSVLVGVMVAVALMPPAVTLGIMLSSGQPSLAFGAALLLAVNVVCLNFAANIVFYAKGVGPRTWREKKQARNSVFLSIAFWSSLLVILMLLIFRQQV